MRYDYTVDVFEELADAHAGAWRGLHSYSSNVALNDFYHFTQSNVSVILSFPKLTNSERASMMEDHASIPCFHSVGII